MSEITLSVGGHTYTFARLDIRLYETFARWAVAKMPDPVDALLATADKLPAAMREKYIADRIDAACNAKGQKGSLTDPALQDMMKTPDGLKKLFHLLLAKHHPHLTEDQAFEVFFAAQDEHGEKVFDEVFDSVKPPMTEEEVEDLTFRKDGTDRTPESVG